jgi:hypothetical protein
MGITKILSTGLLVLAAVVLARGTSLPADPAQATGPAPARQQQRPRDLEASKWPGEWLMEGKADRPCAIFQHGRIPHCFGVLIVRPAEKNVDQTTMSG